VNKLLQIKESYSLIKKSIFIISASIFVTTVFTGCYFLPAEKKQEIHPLQEPKKIINTTVDVKKGNLEKKITVNAKIISSFQEDISFKTSGGIFKKIYFKSGDMVNNGDLLAELETDSLISQIKQQEINVKRWSLNYQQTVAISNATTNIAELDKAKFYLDSENSRLTDLQKLLKNTKIYSSISGNVVFMDSKAIVGEKISVNKNFMSIADPSQLCVWYNGTLISEFVAGEDINIVWNNTVYKGSVVVDTERITTEANKSIKIKFERLPKGLKMGDYCEVTCIKEKKQNIIIIPTNCIINFNGSNFVQVIKDGIKTEVDVETGLKTATEVEIVKGLSEGEKVIFK